MEVARSRVGYRQMLLCFSTYSLCSLCLLFFSPVTVIPYCRLCNVFVCIIFFVLMKNVPRGTVERKKSLTKSSYKRELNKHGFSS